MSEGRNELEAARQRIRELEAQLRAEEPRKQLFEHSLDLMCVAGTDGYFKELNASWSHLLGWSREELTRVPFIEFVHPDDVESTRAVAGRIQAGATITQFSNRYRHKNGSYRWLLWNAVYEPGTKNVLAVARDNTEIVETREALEASEAQYKELFDGMLDGFSYHDMLFDEDGNPKDYRFRAVNPAFEEMTGLKAEDLVGRRVLEVLPGTEQHWIDVFGGVAKTGKPVRYENYSQEFDKWFEVLAYRPGEGQFACTFHDITARKKAEAERAQLQAQVEHAQKLESLGMMAGGIAHDFNNLLTAIVGGVELGVMRADEPARADLNTALVAARRAGELCRQMLAYSGRADTQKEPADLTKVAQEILPLASHSLSKKLTIRKEFSVQGTPVVADLAQLRQVILNLLINAGDAIGDNAGTISVRTGVRRYTSGDLAQFKGADELGAGSYAYVEVEDTGLGMSEETMSKIFEPFFTTKFAGRGLGLAATLGIVKAHGGGILVESEPGRGTCFVVALPEASEKLEEATSAMEEQPSWTGAGTILLCDDEEVVRRVVARQVNLLGFDVLEASDGQQALEFFKGRAQGFRAVLLDMTMPRIGGLEVLPSLRERRNDLPVVLMSGHDEQLLAGNLEGEQLTFLRKPFRLEDLKAALGRVLG